MFHGWYLNYLDGFHVSCYLNLCSTDFVLFETVCCSKVIRRKKNSLLQPYVPDLYYTEQMENNDEMNLLMSKKQHLSWGHHMSRSSLGPFFHSAKPTFSHQSLHHFSNCTSLSVVIVSGT